MTVMSSADLRKALKQLGWSRADLARETSTHRNTVNRWVNTGPVPGLAGAYITVMLRLKDLTDLTIPSSRR